MRDPESARALARAMVDIGTAAGRRMAAVVSDMSQPLGRAVGHALEVAEALDALEGHGPPEFTEFALELATLIVSLTSDGSAGRGEVEHALNSGAARGVFRRMVEAQGGNSAAFDDRMRLPRARLRSVPVATDDGYVARVDALTIAHACTLLGAGRERKGDAIDLSVGVVLQARVGDRVSRGQPLAELHANDEERLLQAERAVRDAIEVSPSQVTSRPLILERLLTPAAQPLA
jgi:pyrimidine-nucleoside phosphorylase